MMMLIFQEKKKAFKGYAETYEVETIDNKSLSDSLSVGKNSPKNLFDELLRGKRGFKYVLNIKIISKKYINDNKHTYSTVCFNSLVKTVINQNPFKRIIWRNIKFTGHMD